MSLFKLAENTYMFTGNRKKSQNYDDITERIAEVTLKYKINEENNDLNAISLIHNHRIKNKIQNK